MEIDTFILLSLWLKIELCSSWFESRLNIPGRIVAPFDGAAQYSGQPGGSTAPGVSPSTAKFRAFWAQAHTRTQVFVRQAFGAVNIGARRLDHQDLFGNIGEIGPEMHTAFQTENLLLVRLDTQMAKNFLVSSLHAVG